MRNVLRGVAPLVCAVAIAGAAAGSAAAADRYVALGDSYSSGTGTGSYTLNSGCQRSTYAYPYLASRQRANTDLVFVACSGAKTDDVMANQISSVTASTALVSITIGGNDAGFSSVVTSCVTIGCSSAIANAITYIRNTLPGKLNTVYSAIQRQAPSARVAVLGYPRLFSSSSCAGTTGIDASERTQLNGVADLLDSTIASRAAAYGFSYRSAIPSFTGHAVCSSSAWLNGLNILSTGESFHPNRTGHASGYTPLVRSVIG
ncbi:SGNH/GDSL hydrolase family protein [Conexibacter sp. JD483]|uniref:SGNH/GDSL hydrolase family protein n=1 Tax=unclassified Conexibacter TaxID=2627773 RepID=UPI00271A1991|nr:MULTISPECIES: SGNH/GDSL hydrolase family protein [unclassified Conexibacter]MDO8189177.1 SGNH/GDSL hydrolase family protein [Conexibacter sp. CPCC 205706]MDO8201937.1 SGNH/GDSL hydrolase family protein [Conexibacter sp. CPCC 205762]MDR9372379.1 SGNH/GDSL hydrolase family protein [Conexibacter sp. JD483]